MAIKDAGCLGACLQKHPGNIMEALQQYQAERIPAATREVMFSRHLGQLKQGLMAETTNFKSWTAEAKRRVDGSSALDTIAQRARSTFNPK